MAEERNVAVILVSHFNKGPLGPAINRAMGSVAFTAVARIAWAFIADQEDQDRVLMLPLKNNTHRRPAGLAYRIIEIDGQQTGRSNGTTSRLRSRPMRRRSHIGGSRL